MNAFQEKSIIKEIVQGNTAKFGYLVDNYQDMAINIAYRICRNKQDAEDIVQNSFVKAFHNLPIFNFQSKFSTWFYRIVYNTSISHINNPIFTFENSNSENLENLNISENWNIIDQIEQDERSKIINKAMNELPEEDSLLLTLYYLDEKSVKEIATITALSESNIKIKLFRGRKKLAEYLDRILNEKSILKEY